MSADESIELRARPPKIPPVILSLGVAAGVLITICVIAWYMYEGSKAILFEEIRSGLARSAKFAAAQIDGDVHDQFRGEALNTTAEYLEANQLLLSLTAADKDLAYAYTVIEVADKFYLVLDTDVPEDASDNLALTPYEDAPENLISALREQKALTANTPYTDQWGTFISSYAPFYNSKGKFSGVVGVDLRIANLEQRLASTRQTALIAVGIGVTIALTMAWVVWLSQRRNGAMRQLGRQLSNVNAMLNVSKALGANVGLDNLLPVIVNKTSMVMRAERSSLFLYDKHNGQLRGRVTEGLGVGEEIVIPADRGIAGRVARTGETANVKNPAADPDFDSSFDKKSGFNTRAILAVPIMDSKGGVLGVLQALNPKDNEPFDHDDEAMLHALASQAQVALEREHLNQSANEKRKLEEALKFAQSIQLGMLPHIFPDPQETGVELFATLIPAKMVGGDFYDFVWIDEDRLALVMADVSGKGIPAALLMAKAMTLTRAYLGAEADPAEALRRANEELSHDNDAAMFVTTFAAIYDRTTGLLTYSNAGHNEPYVVRAKQLIPLQGACSVPLGCSMTSVFENATINLQFADLLYLYTDGVNEAMDVDFTEYGDEQLREFLVSHAQAPTRVFANACIDSVRAHANGAEQSDDITVMVMRVRRIG